MFRKGLAFGTGLAVALGVSVVLYAAATYPGGVVSFPVRTDGQTISASWFNSIHDELVAIEGGLINGLSHDLKFTDATYDIGKSGATRPRDGFFSRNLVVGGTLDATGATTLGSTLGVTGAATFTGGTSSLLLTGDAAASPTARTAYRDSLVVAWARIANSGSPTITDDVNVASLTDNGVGDVTLTFATAIASANFACDVTAITGTTPSGAWVHSTSTTTVRVQTYATNFGTLSDVNFSVICVGE